MSINDWARSEFMGVNLGDKRLNERLAKISGQFLASTKSPINKACESWRDTKAAYRFFQNNHVNYTDIVDQHSQATKKRAESENIILAIQDTTYYNYTDHPKTTGLGILSKFTGKYKKDILTLGLYMHTTMAINTNGLVLGVLNQKISSREILPEEKVALKKQSHNIALPIEEKESIRWLDSMKATASIFDGQHQKIVTIADREADIYDLFVLAEELDTHYVIRASHNRKINKTSVHSDISGELLWEFMDKQPAKGVIEVKVPRKENQPKRKAICNVKVGKIKMQPPRNYKGTKPKNSRLSLYSIQVLENKPPEGVDKIEWILYSDIPVCSYRDAVEKIKWYCLRWRIEVYFKVIKSGFNVESCRLQTADRLIRYLAVVSIVAWRVLWLTLVSRTAPDILISEFLNKDEWKVLFIKYNPSVELPSRPPSWKEITVWIARLGGFLARKGDGSPGITHIWRGLEKLSDIMTGVRLGGNIYG